jgi:hypothetical protein
LALRLQKLKSLDSEKQKIKKSKRDGNLATFCNPHSDELASSSATSAHWRWMLRGQADGRRSASSPRLAVWAPTASRPNDRPPNTAKPISQVN